MDNQMYQPNVNALYHGTINDATRELTRIVYEVAKAHDVPYVKAAATMDIPRKRSFAYANMIDGTYTPTMHYYPEEEPTDGQT